MQTRRRHSAGTSQSGDFPSVARSSSTPQPAIDSRALLVEMAKRQFKLGPSEFKLPRWMYKPRVNKLTRQYQNAKAGVAAPAAAIVAASKVVQPLAAPPASSTATASLIGISTAVNPSPDLSVPTDSITPARIPYYKPQISLKLRKVSETEMVDHCEKKEEKTGDVAVSIDQMPLISIKAAEITLQPKMEETEVRSKRFSLESLVAKIGQARKEEKEEGGSPKSDATSSPSESPPEVIEKKRKRKSTDPIRIIPEGELNKNKKKKKGGGKRKAKAKKAPKKKKVTVVEKEEEEEVDETYFNIFEMQGSIDNKQDEKQRSGKITVAGQSSIDMMEEEQGLPPRIVVEGQEPGTELEWDEEEIIVLREGEEPGDRPPRMKRRESPEGNGGNAVQEAKNVKETEEESYEGTPMCLDSIPPLSEDSTDGFGDTSYGSSMPALSRHTSQDTQSANTSTCSSTVTRKKRESIDSISSDHSGRSRRAIRVRERYTPDGDEVSNHAPILMEGTTELTGRNSFTGYEEVRDELLNDLKRKGRRSSDAKWQVA